MSSFSRRNFLKTSIAAGTLASVGAPSTACHDAFCHGHRDVG